MKSNYFKSFVQFFTGNFIVRFISLLREMILAWLVGPSRILDIFFFLITIPNLVNSTWNKALETTLLSRYEKYKSKDGQVNAKKHLSGQLYNFTIFSFLIYILLSLCFPLILYFFYNGYFSKEVVLSVFIINFVFVIETFIMAIKIIKFSEGKFFLPTILPVFQSGLMIFGIVYLQSEINVFYLSVFFTVGSFFQIIIVFKEEFKVLRSFFLNSVNFKSIKTVLKDSSLLSIAAGISSLNLLVDQSFALSIGEAANSYIHYGYYFLTIYSALFVRNINTIYFPQFQKYVLNSEYQKLEEDSQRIIKIILILSTVIFVFMFNNGYYALKLILGHGKVSEQDLKIIYYCAIGYGGAFFGTALNAILIRILHVYLEYRLIMLAAIINFFVNIVLNLIFVKLFGVWGIAVSTSVTFFILCMIYFIYLKKKRDMTILDFSSGWIIRFFMVILILTILELFAFNFLDSYIINSFSINVIVFFTSLLILTAVFVGFKLIDIKRLRVKY